MHLRCLEKNSRCSFICIWKKYRFKEILQRICNALKFKRNKMCCFSFSLFGRNLTMDRMQEKTGSHLNLCPCGIEDFMNHVDAAESYSRCSEQQSVIVVCACVWRECLLYFGPCLCVFVHSCAPNIFTQRSVSLFPENRICCNAAKIWWICFVFFVFFK